MRPSSASILKHKGLNLVEQQRIRNNLKFNDELQNNSTNRGPTTNVEDVEKSVRFANKQQRQQDKPLAEDLEDETPSVTYAF